MKSLRKWFLKFGGLFGRRGKDLDLDEELESHLQFHVDDNLRQGMSPAEARRRAILDLGGIESTREACRDERGWPWLEMLLQDLRYGARQLRRNPGFVAVAVFTLALGIGVNTAIFSVVNALLLRPLPYPDSRRLVMLSINDAGGDIGNSDFATFVDWRERNRSFERMALFTGWSGLMRGQGDPEMVGGVRVTADYFRLLGVPPMLGRDFKPEEDRPNASSVVMISHALWRRRFNSDPNIIGKPVIISDQTFTVVGVMPRGFEDLLAGNFYQPAEMWAPLGYDEADPSACRTCRHVFAAARLKPGVTLGEAKAEMDAVMNVMMHEHPESYSHPDIAMMRLQDKLVGGVRQTLLVLLVAVGFVLLIACANVANLLLARANQRGREMALRLALGARPWRIVRQLLTESLMLSTLGAGLGLLLAMWGTQLLVSLSPAMMLKLEDVKTDSRVLGFTLLASLVTGILFGLFPALQASKHDVQHALKESGKGSPSVRQNRLRGLLVVAEVALALVLMVGAGLLIRSFARILSVTPGFEQRNLLTVAAPTFGARYEQDEQVEAYYRNVIDRVRMLPGVDAAAMVSNLPFSGAYDNCGFHIEEKPLVNPAEAPSAERYVVSPDYLRAMGIPLLKGRQFDEHDNAKAPLVALINKTAADRNWPNENPIGKRISLGDDNLRTIVGIVGDVRHTGLDDGPKMQAYEPRAQMSGFSMSLVARTSVDPDGLTAAVRNEIRAADPTLPVNEVVTMRQLISASVAERRFTLLLLGIFAGVALLMAAIGIYGIISYSVAQRKQEIGIRMALGAQRHEVVQLALGEGFRLVALGLAVGLAGAFALTRALQHMLYRTNTSDPLTLGLVSATLCAAAAIACWLPARRAARLDPMVALRQD
jgi:putative ABC transport system permease protein